jgi:hypothetical protein
MVIASCSGYCDVRCRYPAPLENDGMECANDVFAPSVFICLPYEKGMLESMLMSGISGDVKG